MSQTASEAQAPQERFCVHVRKPRCPRCDSTDLQTIRSSKMSGTLTIRRARCRHCQAMLFVFVE
jgi:hypothetical protein